MASSADCPEYNLTLPSNPDENILSRHDGRRQQPKVLIMKCSFILMNIILLLLSSCAASPDFSGNSDETTPSHEAVFSLPDDSAKQNSEPNVFPGDEAEDTVSEAEKLLASMSAKEKVGQLFLIRPDSLEPSLTPEQIINPDCYGMTEATGGMLSTLKEYPPGGIVFFGKNLTDPSSLNEYMQVLSSASVIPLLYAVDEEGGMVSRIANNDRFGVENIGFMADIGATYDPDEAYFAGRYIGNYLSSLGFSLDFAPVADINTNPNNIVIGIRAFGSDPALVSSMVGSFLSGLHDEGMIGCLKHFPGHGDTSADTHEDYVSVTKTWEQLQSEELLPFVANFDHADMIMIAHLSLPFITDDGLPASLSEELITGKLRNELGYNGLITTDALDMGAIKNNYSSAEAVLLAFESGVDFLLMPYDYKEAFDAIYDAVQSGRISEYRLNESVLRILELKERYGLLS